jgi:tetratricopeptide (TPR) repeat protein
MKKILAVTFFLLSLLMVCWTYQGWAGGLDDAETGLAAAEQGDYDTAIEFFTKAIESGELSVEHQSIVYFNRAVTWDKKGEYDKAIDDYTSTIAIDPKNIYAYDNRGIANYKNGDYDGAIVDYSKIIEIDPNIARTWYNRACCYALKGEKDKAISDLKEAITQDASYKDKAKQDEDLKILWDDADFKKLIE